MKGFVLDASITLAWFIDRPIAQHAEQVRQLLLSGNRAVVPALWQFEIVNGFLVAERRGLFTTSDTADALQDLDLLLGRSIESSRDTVPMRSILHTAREFRLTAYDAAYLETARRQDLPLASLDRQLLAAATKAGVEVLSAKAS